SCRLVAGERAVKDPASQLRRATRRAKSDVANKLISMFLHELSRSVSQHWKIRVDGEEYENLVRQSFDNHCPYCLCSLTITDSVVEHLDGMNRFRAGLHVPGNVLVACRKCNSEKRRDDSLRTLTLAETGWESFLSHDGARCIPSCQTCQYWEALWKEGEERKKKLADCRQRIHSFRQGFPEFQSVLPALAGTLPTLLTKLYSDCQVFAETEIKSLLDRFSQMQTRQI
ncbi:MAG: HNH endonuclease, partial [Acidobacteriota bacterium]|nr:HNH endonuclease [Acidobacteriota bacterium]